MSLNYDLSGDPDGAYAEYTTIPSQSPSRPFDSYRLLFPDLHKKCCPDGTSTHSFLVDLGITTPFTTPPTQTTYPISGRATKDVVAESPARNKRPSETTPQESNKRRRGSARVLLSPEDDDDYDEGTEEVEEVSERMKGKVKALPQLTSDDEDLIREAKEASLVIGDDGSIREEDTPPPKRYADRRGEDDDLEGFVVPDEDSDEEILPASFRSAKYLYGVKKAAAGKKISMGTPSGRIQRPMPKTVEKTKGVAGGLGRGLLKDKILKQSGGRSASESSRNSLKMDISSPEDNGEGSSRSVASGSIKSSYRSHTAESREGSLQPPPDGGATFLTPEERNDPLLRELRSSTTNPSNPLPKPVFPSRDLLGGRMNKIRIRFDHCFEKLADLMATNNWERVAAHLDQIGHSREMVPEYLTPSLRLIIKKIAFDVPPFRCSKPEGRARNIAALTWARWYLGIYDPDPSQRIPRSQKGKRSQKNSTLGYVSGEIFKDRATIIKADLHRSFQGGIAGYKDEGAHSIVLSKSDYDDHDRGDELWYSGTDSKDGVTTTLNTRLMETAMERENKIRVFRTKECGWLAPSWGIRFDGMYVIKDKRRTGPGNWQFKLVREDDQWPILHPTPRYMSRLG